jgi:hypothetical protein
VQGVDKHEACQRLHGAVIITYNASLIQGDVVGIGTPAPAYNGAVAGWAGKGEFAN